MVSLQVMSAREQAAYPCSMAQYNIYTVPCRANTNERGKGRLRWAPWKGKVKDIFKHCMVPHPRLNNVMTDSNRSHVSFDGYHSSEIARFSSGFKNVMDRGKTDAAEALQTLLHLKGTHLDFYYQSYAQEGSHSEEYGSTSSLIRNYSPSQRRRRGLRRKFTNVWLHNWTLEIQEVLWQ